MKKSLLSNLLSWIAGMLFAGSCGPLPGALAAQSKPNILLVMTDDQGYWDTGVSGNEKIDTPVMDSLSAEGVTFSHFYAAPVCSPTRSGLMTGRYYLRTGLYNTRFGGDSLGRHEITVAELLKKAGYRTGIFGKWHLGRYSGYQPQQRGFDEFLGHYHGHIERYDYPDQLVHNGVPVEARGYVTDLFTDAAMEFIASTRDQPFFCYLAYNAPHSPWVVGTSHDGLERGDVLIDKYLRRGLELRNARIYAMVDLIDQNLRRLLKRIDDLGLRDDTVVVFLSDNGGVSKGYSAGLRGAKASVYEGGVRVPFFARWPGRFPAGAMVNAMASHVDLLPTFCELAGAAVPADRTIDGRSLLPLLQEGKGSAIHDYVYHTWNRDFPDPDERWAVSDGRFKLLNQLGEGSRKSAEPAGALYDMIADPGETKDIAGQHPEVVKRLREEFLRWFADATQGQTYAPVAIPVGRPDEGTVEIQPSWATWRGDTIRYTFRGYDWDTIDTWSRRGESASWRLDVTRSGRYIVTLSYGCSKSSLGGVLGISAGDSSLRFEPRATPTGDVFAREEAGILDLKKGPVDLKAEVLKSSGRELMRLNRIRLKRIGP